MPRTLTQPRPLALLALAAALLAAITALLQSGLAGASGDTVVALVPSGEVRAGQLITVKLVVSNASDLAGYQGAVRYDAGLRLTGASVDAGLARSGRGLVPLGPVMGDGSVVLGAATCPLSDCGDTPGAALPRVAAGVAGTVELGTLEFYGAAPGRYQISLEGLQLVDPQGSPLPARAEPLVIDVKP